MKYKCLICNKPFRCSAFNCCNVTWTNDVTKTIKLYRHRNYEFTYYHNTKELTIELQDGSTSCGCGDCPDKVETRYDFSNAEINRNDFYNNVDRYLKFLVFM